MPSPSTLRSGTMRSREINGGHRARRLSGLPGLPGQEGGDGQVLLAGLVWVPAGLAGRAELQHADGALDQLGQRHVRLLQLAHRLARRGRAPGSARVQQHLCGQTKPGGGVKEENKNTSSRSAQNSSIWLLLKRKVPGHETQAWRRPNDRQINAVCPQTTSSAFLHMMERTATHTHTDTSVWLWKTNKAPFPQLSPSNCFNSAILSVVFPPPPNQDGT